MILRISMCHRVYHRDKKNKMSRYDKLEINKNTSGMYNDFFKERNIKLINHYSTMELVYPTAKQLDEIDLKRHLWASGDAYWKLSQQYYNTPTYWWVIAFINKTPVDSQLTPGDIIEIPLDIYKILNIIQG